MNKVSSIACFLMAIGSLWLSALGVERFAGTVLALASAATGLLFGVLFFMAAIGAAMHDE